MRLRHVMAPAGVAVLAVGSAVWAAEEPGGELSGYEIARNTFLTAGANKETSVEGTATCSSGKLVLGGGGRVIRGDQTAWHLSASEPAGPTTWTAVFTRTPPPPEPEEPEPLLPTPAAQEEPTPQGESQFEVSAVCAVLR